MEYISTSAFLWSCGILLTIIVGLIGFIVRHIIGNQREVKLELSAEQHRIQEEMTEIKENYLDRFGKVYKMIGESTTEIKCEINKLGLAVCEIQTTLKLNK